jgi:glycosyltransferase involved in cell wall biosynthesis
MADGETYFELEIGAIRASGLFLESWYVARQPAAAAGGDALEYFCRRGWRLGDFPNPYFDPGFYLASYQDVARSGLNPLFHYIMHGDKEARDPCRFFHVQWYRAQYGLGVRDLTLKHFLERRFSGEVAPVPLFDPIYYFATNPDVAGAGADPFEHFLAFGVAELRDPCADFDMKFYLARYGAVLNGQNPLLHYLANRESGLFSPVRPDHEKLIPGAVKRASRPSPHFEEFRPVPPGAAKRAQLLAFYLPQFHRIAENDAWWGKGFTDWTNLARALPRFAGHLQPRVPRDLGFYDLDDPAVLRRQIALAAGAGLSGFVFYFYWFNGRRLLEGPLERLLADATLDFPFCVMWANENFTRRWDGLERDVLMTQEYRETDDAALVACFARLFADARYIRIDNRPLLMIYRASLIPDAVPRIAAWRALFRKSHGENPIIIMAQSLGDYDPVPYGLDGAVEFPPHKVSDEVPTINGRLDLFDADFSAAVYDYQEIAAASLAAPAPDYPLIKTIAPGWDNDPRREGKGLVLHDATPAKYQAWLEGLVARAGAQTFFGAPLVCVNAWNEWAEGAFLEPDIHFGAAFLNATGRVICGVGADARTGLLLVGHDAQPHGAQMLLLNLARHYARVWGFEVHVLLLGAGPLVTQYQAHARVTLTNDKATIANTIAHYASIGITTAIVNSAAAAGLVPALAARGMEVTLLVHEMPRLLAEYNLQVQAKLGALAAKHVVFASDFARESFAAALGIKLPAALILPQGNYQGVGYDETARAEVRRRLGIGDAEFMVLGAGFGDLRKGFDLFVQMARKTLGARADVHFVWVGNLQPGLKTYLGAEMAAAGATGRFHHIGFTEAIAPYFSAADVFALTSREDPYPTVALEAFAAGAALVAFDESGGIPGLIRAHQAGAVAAALDVDNFRERLLGLLDHDALRPARGRLAGIAAAEFSQSDYARRLVLAARPGLRRVSVCVAAGEDLRARLAAVFAQSYPVCEVLVLDDEAGQIAVAHRREVRLVADWRAAAGDYIWFAGAGDVAGAHFLSRVVEAMVAQDAAVGVCDSIVVDEAGRLVSAGAGAPFDPERLPGAGAVVWRRDALVADFETHEGWRQWLAVAAKAPGRVASVAVALNTHCAPAAPETPPTRAGRQRIRAGK